MAARPDDCPRDAGSAPSKTSVGKAAQIEALLAPALAAMGYDIVRVLLAGNERQRRLQIMAERKDGSGMDLNDCAEVSRASEAILDVEDPIAGAYVLEVSSPGMDRPLTRLTDFERFAGHEAKVELLRPVEGRRRFRGRLSGVEDAQIRIVVEGTEWRLPFDEVEKAKLVLTDEQLAAAQRRRDEDKGGN